MIDDDNIIYFLQNFRCIPRICKCSVETLGFLYFQLIYRMLQCTSVRAVVITDTVQLLHIIIGHRSRKQFQQIIKFHIPLKFHYILIPPGKKIPVFSAPFKELSGCLFKRYTLHKIFVIHMNHFMNAVMDPVVNLRLDQSVKMIRYFFFSVYFYSSDLDNLKWKSVVACFLSRRVLVPFQVKDNIVHSSVPFSLLHFRIYSPLLINSCGFYFKYYFTIFSSYCLVPKPIFSA